MEASHLTHQPFPVIDLAATGANILRLRQAKGYSVRDLQHYFGFEEPQAIYKWQQGKSLPSVDNLYALSTLLGVPMNEILIPSTFHTNSKSSRPQPAALAIFGLRSVSGRGGHGRIPCLLRPLSAVSRRLPPRKAAARQAAATCINEVDGPKPHRPWAEA